MKNKKIKSAVYFCLIIIGILGIVGYVSADACPVGAICIDNPLEAETFDELINSIIDFIFVVGVALSVLMVSIGAVYIVTAGGDSEKVKAGKNIILYTFIALIIILLAKALIYVIKSVLGE